jgi:hypothetical protein
MRRLWLSLVLGVLSMSGTAWADERIDVGLLLGWTAASNEGGVLHFDRGQTYQATFAWHIWTHEDVNLSIEVPFLASPSFGVTPASGPLPTEYASLYLTPGVRVTVPVHHPVSVFGSVGGGYARYSEATKHFDGSPNPGQQDTNTGALQFGGGVDVRALRWFGFRGEIRDVYTGARKFSISTPGAGVHNVVASGGFVLHF